MHCVLRPDEVLVRLVRVLLQEVLNGFEMNEWQTRLLFEDLLYGVLARTGSLPERNVGATASPCLLLFPESDSSRSRGREGDTDSQSLPRFAREEIRFWQVLRKGDPRKEDEFATRSFQNRSRLLEGVRERDEQELHRGEVHNAR